MPVGAETYPRRFGRYQLLRKLAQGGMAEIFLAQDEQGGICAIKRILPHLAHEESFIRMFIDEARIVSHLNHPNIAAVYDQGKEEGYYYMAMEFVQGHSLLALSERAKATKMELPRGLLAFVVAELLAGLGFAHSAHDARGRHLGIVHRDVTPQNVLISYSGDVKLVDFGVAKARSRLTQTEAGFTKGKLAYMSPEQARGETLDGRSDLFSVGIIVHEITTNSRLFNKEGPGGILGAIVNDPIPRPSARIRNYPLELESIVLRALEKDVARRYQTGEEMREDLLRFGRLERPPPSRTRLSALVHDLFGDPDSQGVIDRARESAQVTPPPAPVFPEDLDTGPDLSNPQAAAADISTLGKHARRGDETRMLKARALKARGRSKDRVGVTHAGVPTAGSVLASQFELDVPTPELPPRVRLGRFLRDLGSDFRLSWREHQRRWWLGLSAAALICIASLMAATGGLGAVARWASAAAEAAREAKSGAGLGPGPVEDGHAEPMPTRVSISSEPPGAHIVINGLGMGAVTPHVMRDLPMGRPLHIELHLAGYRRHEERLVLHPGQGLREEHFNLERMEGGLSVISEPKGAEIWINGKPSGRTAPAELDGLSAGATVRVEARLKGRVSRTVAVVVPDGESRQVHLQLPIDRKQIPLGRLTVSSRPSGCPVYLDESYLGTTPIAGHRSRPGLYTVKVACEHYADELRSVSILSNEEARLDVEPRPNTFGYLSIQVVPAQGSIVEINGRAVQTPVRFLKVVPGRHVVTVRNRRLNAEKQMSVNVGPNARVRRNVSLTF